MHIAERKLEKGKLNDQKSPLQRETIGSCTGLRCEGLGVRFGGLYEKKKTESARLAIGLAVDEELRCTLKIRSDTNSAFQNVGWRFECTLWFRNLEQLLRAIGGLQDPLREAGEKHRARRRQEPKKSSSGKTLTIRGLFAHFSQGENPKGFERKRVRVFRSLPIHHVFGGQGSGKPLAMGRTSLDTRVRDNPEIAGVIRCGVGKKPA